VGLEGGLDVVQYEGRRLAFLESWAYVADTQGRSAYGCAGGILLPDALTAEVVDREVELSEAIDAYAGGTQLRDGQGAWGCADTRVDQ
jgi:non-canonical (house-cleaning) NTP pyrophosphatase